MKQYLKLLAVAAMVTVQAAIGLATTYTLEAGAYRTPAEANEHAEVLSRKGVPDVRVKYERHAVAAHYHHVNIGAFTSIEAARAEKALLLEKGIIAYLRSDAIGYEEALAAVHGRLPAYFTSPNLMDGIATTAGAELQEPYKSLSDRISSGTPPSKETLATMAALVQQMPDDHPLKAQEILRLAEARFAGHSAYRPHHTDHLENLDMLTRVARREVAATPQQRRTAMAKAVLIMHYYNHDYVNAIRGYHQLLNSNEGLQTSAALVSTRTSFAAAIKEMSLARDFPTSETLAPIHQLYTQNSELQKAFLDADTDEARKVRSATASLGLVVCQTYMDEKQWETARALVTSFIETYKFYPECFGAVGEAWCLYAEISSELGQYDQILHGSLEAEKVTRQAEKVWADYSREPLWKSYTWRLVAAYHLKNEELAEQTKAVMREQFADHPDLHNYIGPPPQAQQP